MAQFDDLVAKYRNLTYGRLVGTNPSAVNSLLNAQDRGTNSITSPNYFGNIPIEQQQYIDTPSGFIGQNQFRIDPNTGIPVFETPTTEAINQGIEMGGGTVGSGAYDQNVDYGDPGYAGIIPVDPVTGLVGTTTQQRTGGGGKDGQNGFMDNRSLSDKVNDVYGPYAGIKQLGLGALVPGAGPLALANAAYTKYELDKQYGIGNQEEGSQYADVYNKAIKSGDGPVEAAQKAAIMGGGTYTDKVFDEANLPGMSINKQLSDLEKELYGTDETTPQEEETTFGGFIESVFGGNDNDNDNNNNNNNNNTGIGGFTEADENRESFRGGGNNNDNDKIICTMMNESYGFGSYRNAIWLKYSKDYLLPEHQIGYHKIFLPLVAHAKGKGLSNYIVKIIIEHLTRHRTIDCKQEMRGKKRHTLGRIYRSIFEPLCYIVGKYGK